MLSSITWGTNAMDLILDDNEHCAAQQAGTASSSYTGRKRHGTHKNVTLLASYKRHFFDALDRLNCRDVFPAYSKKNHEREGTLDWGSFPSAFTVEGGHVPTKRVQRKTYQVENMVNIASTLIEHASRRSSSRVVVVEFCAGSGFIALPLCFMFPNAHFVIVDLKVSILIRILVRFKRALLGSVPGYC
jgi:hypothetical protein